MERIWNGRESTGKPKWESWQWDQWCFGNSCWLPVLLTLQELRSGLG